MYQRFAILLSAGALAVTVACSQTDAGITSAVKSKMAADDTVKASEINVDTHDHVVTLNGTVGSQAEKERAVMIARNTNGVNSVVDDLRVGPVATSGSPDRDRVADRDRDYSESAKQTAREGKDKTEDAAHDAVTAFPKNDVIPPVGAFPALLCYGVEPYAAVLQSYASHQLLHISRRHAPTNAHGVFALDLVARVQHPVRKLT